MANRELESEVYCPTCRHLYGSVFRVQIGEAQWEHQTMPATIPKYCGICECPTERKDYA